MSQAKQYPEEKQKIRRKKCAKAKRGVKVIIQLLNSNVDGCKEVSSTNSEEKIILP